MMAHISGWSGSGECDFHRSRALRHAPRNGFVVRVREVGERRVDGSGSNADLKYGTSAVPATHTTDLSCRDTMPLGSRDYASGITCRYDDTSLRLTEQERAQRKRRPLAQIDIRAVHVRSIHDRAFRQRDREPTI